MLCPLVPGPELMQGIRKWSWSLLNYVLSYSSYVEVLNPGCDLTWKSSPCIEISYSEVTLQGDVPLVPCD